ncbi:MAG: hypothetical protein UHK60_04410 [Acutalibacteraceae bacterium]|nr:hypothetical protein [Acutalibacteraceae bacterium]
MNVKDRYKAKQEAKEEAYYKGMEAPQTKMVDTGNGFTQVQTNTDKNGPVNAPVQNNKQTTLQNYKPVEQAKPQPEAEAQPKEEVPQEEVAPVANDTTTPETPETPETSETPDIKVDVPEVDEEMMSESGINPKNTEEQNKKGTENAISEITGGRNKDGTYKPLNKIQYADGIQKFGIFATIASIGLAVLTRGAFPPVDFSAMTGLNESYAKYLKGIDNYNKYIRQAQGENAYEAERAKGSIDDANKAADLNAAGEDHSKETDAKWAEHSKNIDAVIAQDKAKLDHALEVALQDVLTEGQIAVINANAEVQKAIAELLNKHDVNLISDQAKAILDAKFSNGDLNKLAQVSKAQAGQTYLENIFKGVNVGANAAGTVINAVKGGTGSDAGTKEFFKRIIKF